MYTKNVLWEVLLLILLFVLMILAIPISKAIRYHKYKNAKPKFLFSVERLSPGWRIWVLIMVVLETFSIWNKTRSIYFIITKEYIYAYIVYLIFIIICVWVISFINSSIILISEDFIDICNLKLNYGEINYVEISKAKGFFNRKRVEISHEGKIKVRLSISNKNAGKLAEIFKDKCRVIM
ncbi:hypothetical protein [Desnuesiella massiliensis]|uniref:hypothetical protein n=1 Tax=Desnuesiella massiliensis TaxID=1650662 RepID=UPI0006E1F2E0|nr:hypothetical protein [Desnuesiella massiliensis]